MMILAGYIGQFYKTANIAALPIGCAIVTVFFVHVLYLINNVIEEAKTNLPAPAAAIMGSTWWLFLISWMLYPGGYLIPVLMNSEARVVGRQLAYTIADISSKVIYRVLLSMAVT